MFEDILLEQEQKVLLVVMVEAARNVPRDQRQKFIIGQTMEEGASLIHPGLPGRRHRVFMGDVEALAHEGLLAPSHGRGGSLLFDVAPKGFRYYEYLKQSVGQPVQRVESTMRDYLTADSFQRKYAAAYQKWAAAEAILWASDSDQQLTTIGHLCREALQEFAAALAEQYQPPNVDKDKTHTVARVRAVLDLRAGQLGRTEKPFLDALLAYWGTLSDLIQRQEHGGQREGDALVWEDGRRVVFQTAVVLFEIDRSLARTG